MASISVLDGCVVTCSDFRRFGHEVRKNGSINTPVVVVCSLVDTIMMDTAFRPYDQMMPSTEFNIKGRAQYLRTHGPGRPAIWQLNQQ